MNAMA